MTYIISAGKAEGVTVACMCVQQSRLRCIPRTRARPMHVSFDLGASGNATSLGGEYLHHTEGPQLYTALKRADRHAERERTMRHILGENEDIVSGWANQDKPAYR